MSSTVFNLRIERNELTALEQAAHDSGISLAEYMRKSTALHPLQSILVKPQIGITISIGETSFGFMPTYSENGACAEVLIH